MKIPYLFLIALSTLVTTGCPRYVDPPFCEAPGDITLELGCYNPAKGLTLRAAKPVTSDASLHLEWTIYMSVDTAATAQLILPPLTITSTDVVTLPDSVLGANRKLYVEVRTACTGKAPGNNHIAYVKRFDKASACYTWGLQPF